MSANRLFIHIGLPRTASTSLQVLLCEASRFSGCPFAYPSFSIDRGKSRFGHNNSVLGEKDSYGRRVDASISQGLIDEILTELPLRNVVISAENLWSCSPVAIAKIFSDLGVSDQVTILFSVRPYVDFTHSFYRFSFRAPEFRALQFLRSTIGQILHCRTQANTKPNNYSIFDYCRINEWQHCFPTVSRLKFPPGPSPLVDLASIIGLESTPIEWHDLGIHINQSKPAPPPPVHCTGKRLVDAKSLANLIIDVGLDSFTGDGLETLTSQICSLPE